MKNITDFFEVSAKNDLSNESEDYKIELQLQVENENLNAPQICQECGNRVPKKRRKNVHKCIATQNQSNEPKHISTFTSSHQAKGYSDINQKELPKMNAFHIMMESRNKIIGKNSSGKELHEVENFVDGNKRTTLLTRKKMLSEWAEIKGASKRKREEDEKDGIIKNKMTKRAKRLKKLLKFKNNSETITTDLNIKRSKRRIRKILSDSEPEDTNANFKPEDYTIVPKIKEKNVDKNIFELNGSSVITNLHEQSLISRSKRNIDYKYDTTGIEGSDKVKYKKKSKRKKKDIHSDESIRDSLDKSKIHKMWKMRIKINENQIDSGDTKQEVSKSYEHEKISDDESKMHSDKSTISISSSENEDNFELKQTPNKPLKIAPVFAKATPKPKVDPDILGSRRQFLLSGTPESLKKVVDKQQSYYAKEFDIFPSISHVQQKCDNPYWNLTKPNVELLEGKSLEISNSLMICKQLSDSNASPINLRSEVAKVGKLKVLLNKIKSHNPSYPVYRSFKFIFKKSSTSNVWNKDNSVTPVTKQKQGKKKQNKDLEVVITDSLKCEQDVNEFAMWTEKYKPKCSNDILGNSEAIKSFKKWLETWKNFSQEINFKKNHRNSSSSEFESTDCDSRGSEELPGNTVILGGPCGSGKSSAVYAICEELGLNIIEINASSKRTGKKFMQELQEATQSHQVRKANTATNYFDLTNAKKQTENKDQQSERKMCVLLVEDIDVVFEQDEGFICSLNQLINTSKRPIILTTTDYNSSFVQKFLYEYQYIPFKPLSSSLLGTWLQILCLVEGVFIEKGDIGSLLDWNKGDIRKTILQLQFWVQSGGQLILNDMPVKIEYLLEETEEKYIDDKDLGLLKDEKKGNNCITHKDCIRSFQIFHNQQSYYIPYYLDLGLLWWNIPNIFEWPKTSNKIKQEGSLVQKQSRQIKSVPTQNINYPLLIKFYENLLFTDVMFKKVDYINSSEPNIRNHIQDVTDSLELNQRITDISSDLEFMHEITHSLVNGSVKEYKNKENVSVKLNVGLPGKKEKSWRAKQHLCEDTFREGLGLVNYERKSFGLDYFPCLRNISRSENQKMTSNTKRGNRFRSYLKSLGINSNDNTINLACSILQESYDNLES